MTAFQAVRLPEEAAFGPVLSCQVADAWAPDAREQPVAPTRLPP